MSWAARNESEQVRQKYIMYQEKRYSLLRKRTQNWWTGDAVGKNCRRRTSKCGGCRKSEDGQMEK